jgi:hypothetical protein
MMAINIFDWYYRVGGDDAKVYQTKSNAYVPVADADYQAWLAANPLGPNNAEHESDLWEIVQRLSLGLPVWLFNGTTFVQPAVGQYSTANLYGYSEDKRNITLNAGITVNGLPFATDPLTVGSLNTAYIYTQAKTADTFSWKLPDGSWVTLNKASIAALQNAVSGYGQDCFDCEASTLDAIDAGTITGLAQIDAAFAAVQNTFTSVAGLEVTMRRKKPKWQSSTSR